MRVDWIDIVRATIGAIIVAVFLCFFCACKSAAPIVAPAYNDSTRTRVETKYDSIFVDRWHTIREKGDTVFVHDSIFVEKWREKHLTDTVFISKKTPYPVEVVKEVRRRNWYDRATATGFWILLGVAALIIVWKIAKCKFRVI